MNRDEYYIALEENKACLQHHGIKGQKWGLRRYQNPDGTLTEEGKKHYGYNVLPKELMKQTIHEATKSTDQVKNARIAGTTMAGMMGVLPGAVKGGLTAGPIGAVLGGIGGATLGGLLGYSVSRLGEKINSRSYEKSKKKVDKIIENYGDEKVDGDKIKDLVKLYKEGINYKVSNYYNPDPGYVTRQGNEAFQRHMNEVNQQNFQRFIDNSIYQANPVNMHMLGMM